MTGYNYIASNVSALNALRYMAINNEKQSLANAALASGLKTSDPSNAPMESAIGSSFTATIASETQAASNVTQASAMIQMATGLTSSAVDLLTAMKAKATQANSDTISDASRAMIDVDYQRLVQQLDVISQTTWNGTALFSGQPTYFNRAGTVAAASANLISTQYIAASSVSTTGFVNGNVSYISATDSLNDGASVSVVIGNQVFINETTNYQTAGVITLTSVSNPASTISFTLTEGLIPGATAADLATQLNTVFGLSGGVPATLTSASNSLTNAVTITTNNSTLVGSYSLNIVAGNAATSTNAVYTLTNGIETWQQTGGNSTTGNTLIFGNGVTVTVSDETNAAFTATAYENFAVSQLSNNVNVQVGGDPNTCLSLSFQGLNASNLGLTGSNVKTTLSAAIASSLINQALTYVNTMQTTLGGSKTQLSFQSNVLMTQIQNETGARSTFIDADIGVALQDSMLYGSLAQMATNTFANEIKKPAELAQLVAQGLRG